MAPYDADSERLTADPGFSAPGFSAQYLLLLCHWAVSTSWFLYLLTALLVGISLWVSFNTDAWHWFQRSGALVVSIGAVLSTRHPLRLILEGMLGRGSSAPSTSARGSILIDKRELRTCVCGFIFVAMGTLIWAYGDLLGCLLLWNSSCLG